MSNQHYEPTQEDARVTWLTTLAAALPQYAATLGLAAADTTSVQDDANYFKYMVGAADAYNSAKLSWVDYKKFMKSAPIGTPAGAIPQVPNIGVAPKLVAPGIMSRIHALINRIKSNANYTDNIGKALGIVGAADSTDINTLKPTLKLTFIGGQMDIKWKKGISDAAKIEVDRDGKGFVMLAICTVPHYVDTVVPTAAATWKYRAMYQQHDAAIGLLSDVVSINVG